MFWRMRDAARDEAEHLATGPSSTKRAPGASTLSPFHDSRSAGLDTAAPSTVWRATERTASGREIIIQPVFRVRARVVRVERLATGDMGELWPPVYRQTPNLDRRDSRSHGWVPAKRGWQDIGADRREALSADRRRQLESHDRRSGRAADRRCRRCGHSRWTRRTGNPSQSHRRFDRARRDYWIMTKLNALQKGRLRLHRRACGSSPRVALVARGKLLLADRTQRTGAHEMRARGKHTI